MSPLFEKETVDAPRQIVGNALITPRAQQISLRLPVVNFRWNWSRPVHVLVERVDRPAEMIGILDVTRVAQIAILLLGLVGAVIISRSRSQGRANSSL